MRAFFAIIIKDLRVRFSSPMELVFFILLPLVFTVVLSGASMAGSGKGKAAPLVLIHDGVESPASRAFTMMMGTMPDIRVQHVSDPTALISTTGPDLLLSLTPSTDPRHGLPFTLTFRPSPWRGSAGATAQRVGDWLEAARSGAGATTGAAADPSIAAAASAAPAAPAAPEVAPAAPAIAPAAPVANSASVATVTGDGVSAAATSNAGQIITWALVPLLGLGAGFITERRRGTMRRIHTTPAPRSVVTAASVAAEMLGALVQIGLLISFGALAFHLPWFSHPVELVGLSVAFCAAGASLGAVLGALCRTPRQAGSLGLALSMVLAVFGGCWYPSRFFPPSLRGVTGLDPAGWAMDGFLAVLAPAAASGTALRSTALLLGFGLVVFLLAAAASRARRSSMA
jgi:ABC-2 type transport system permease protein